ncbi:hypothetical protein ACFSQT_16640 [Mesorhizobium calcicola]|uniref:Uncharacterized protein n=1 Tax=Mesorhizobium calcicola TaxID=1300310 RepID=A0ABW4WGV7_9HYPH
MADIPRRKCPKYIDAQNRPKPIPVRNDSPAQIPNTRAQNSIILATTQLYDRPDRQRSRNLLRAWRCSHRGPACAWTHKIGPQATFRPPKCDVVDRGQEACGGRSNGVLSVASECGVGLANGANFRAAIVAKTLAWLSFLPILPSRYGRVIISRLTKIMERPMDIAGTEQGPSDLCA